MRSAAEAWKLGLVLAVALRGIAFAQTETEPNDSKATANLFTLPLVSTTGVIAGNSTAGTGVGLDYFRVTTPDRAAPGFYRHRLIATSTTAGHTVTVRGLNQVAGVPGTVDSTVQTSSTATTPPRFVQWYTSHAGGQLFVRVTGGAATTADYRLDYEVQAVLEVAGPGPLEGTLTITTVGQSAPQTDTDLWIYDSDRTAIVDFGNDDELGTASLGSSLTRTFAPGGYYLVLSNFNLANSLGSPPDDDFRSGLVLDFPGIVVNSSTSVNLDLDSLIDGTPQAALKSDPFEVVFIALGPSLIFADGFESSDTSAWSSVVP
jgi:hypothetical protein